MEPPDTPCNMIVIPNSYRGFTRNLENPKPLQLSQFSEQQNILGPFTYSCTLCTLLSFLPIRGEFGVGSFTQLSNSRSVLEAQLALGSTHWVCYEQNCNVLYVARTLYRRHHVLRILQEDTQHRRDANATLASNIKSLLKGLTKRCHWKFGVQKLSWLLRSFCIMRLRKSHQTSS